MQTVKGFTEEEILDLARSAEQAERDNEKISRVFERIAEKYGRAQGSVRNFYYEFLRMCEKEEPLKAKYFSTPPRVNRAKPFTAEQTEELVRKILIGKKLNKSVRRSISELARGEERLALRLQNKYRNVMKTNPSLIKKTAEELGLEEDRIVRSNSAKVPDFTLKLLKQSIDGMVEGIAERVKKENQRLKLLCDKLAKENTALKELVARQEKEIEGIAYNSKAVE